MNYNIKVASRFARELKQLSKKYHSIKQDYAQLLEELYDNPNTGVDLGNGLRKVRMAIASKGKGKSHGARVITFTVLVSVEETEINLLTIYDKAERDSISKHEMNALLSEAGLR